MTFDAFILKYLGTKVDWDGAYAGQCVDLFRQYVNDCLSGKQPKGVVGAADFWTNYDTDPNLNQCFEKIANTPTGVPLKGDVMIWNKNAGGGFGHISIFIEGTASKFTSLDQNWPTLSLVTKTSHYYTNVFGWLRPKENMTADEMIIKKTDFERLVTKATKLDEILAKYNVADPQALFNMISGYQARITDLGNQLGTSQAQTDNYKELLSRKEEELIAARNDVKALLDRIEEAASTIEQLGKDKGNLAIQLAQLQVQFDSLKAGSTQGLTKDSTLSQFVEWLKGLFFRN